MEKGERRRETGDSRWETGDGRQETGDGRQETGDVMLRPENLNLRIKTQPVTVGSPVSGPDSDKMVLQVGESQGMRSLGQSLQLLPSPFLSCKC